MGRGSSSGQSLIVRHSSLHAVSQFYHFGRELYRIFFCLVGVLQNVHVKLPEKEGDGEEGFLSASIYEDLRFRTCRKRRPFLQFLLLVLIYSILLPFLFW